MSGAGPRDALLGKAIGYFAANGVGDTSLRTLAAGVGTSHRMLIYHFGSREGLLTEVIGVMARRQLEDLGPYLGADLTDPRSVAWRAWTRMADDTPIFAPLLFELSAYAMTGHEWAGQLRELIAQGVDRLARFFERLGHPPNLARTLAHTAMALSRGTAFDLALTGDRAAADAVIRGFLDVALPPDRS